ncbi:hypothetical protein POM88_047971 [Heracleum sosnowskyi]|uniref:Peptidase S54 rhomboid domain-containing protein n=1 Tax=Heracleum sosnowskyi TaxID=360622 RepID=A0AAD8GV72_9APIA|nr:hypothetical protein POM88_047971 [Heracleum sosnowskyi]
MGVLDWRQVVGDQGWRLITWKWLHGRVFHILAYMLCLLAIGMLLNSIGSSFLATAFLALALLAAFFLAAFRLAVLFLAFLVALLRALIIALFYTFSCLKTILAVMWDNSSSVTDQSLILSMMFLPSVSLGFG